MPTLAGGRACKQTGKDGPNVNGAGTLDFITRLGQQTANRASGASMQRAGWRHGREGCEMEGCAHLGVLWCSRKSLFRIGRRAQVKPRNLELQAPGAELQQMRDALEEAFVTAKLAKKCIVGQFSRELAGTCCCCVARTEDRVHCEANDHPTVTHGEPRQWKRALRCLLLFQDGCLCGEGSASLFQCPSWAISNKIPRRGCVRFHLPCHRA